MEEGSLLLPCSLGRGEVAFHEDVRDVAPHDQARDLLNNPKRVGLQGLAGGKQLEVYHLKKKKKTG